MTDEQQIKICDLYRSGMSIAKVGLEVGCANSTVLRVLRAFKVERRSYQQGQRASITAEDEVSICQQYEQGGNQYSIAAQYKTSPIRIGRILEKHGWHYKYTGRRRVKGDDKPAPHVKKSDD